MAAERPGSAVNEVLVASGRLRAHVDRTFALEEAATAHALGESSGFVGKLVLIPRAKSWGAFLTIRRHPLTGQTTAPSTPRLTVLGCPAQS